MSFMTLLTNFGFVATSNNLLMFANLTEKRWAVTTASSTIARNVTAMPKTATAANRVVICPECKKEVEVRSGFAHATLTRHMKEHKK
jgi:hypothetical protein